MTPIERARAGFAATYGHEPAGVAFAPGRVNLIGEHVDYNDGLVLPMPISAGTAVAWSAAAAAEYGRIDAVALDLDGARDSFPLGPSAPHQPPDWRSYLRGMTVCLTQRGYRVRGARLAIAGSIPRGSGLSSSASLCIALGRALAGASGGVAVPAKDLALAAQAAEHTWAGVHCGIMDQMAIAAGHQGQALLLDCRDLSTRRVTLPSDWAVLIVQSGVQRGLVDGHYNQRRSDCEVAAAAIGVAALRDATLAQVEAAMLDPAPRNRARHVVTEIARVSQAVAAIEAQNLPALGRILHASHASLRDQFEVSVPAVDALTDCLQTAIGESGGARMTGGGFGGAVVAVLCRAEVERVMAAIRAGYRQPDGSEPLMMHA